MAIDLPPVGPLDPAVLAVFRQQAAAIVAQERGLTTACRIKIKGLARQLGIPEPQIEPAIRSLGETAVVDAPPNPQAEKFRRRLRKDLAGKSTILGPTIEAQILAAAARKYSLDDGAARQVLADVAAELGLTRISASEAIRNLEGQIDHALGEATWLAREAWDRLRSAGAKWGIELELVDQLIDEKLAANRAARARRRYSTRMTLLAAFSAISCAALVLGILMWIRSRPDETAKPGTDIATTEPVLEKPKAKSPPEWWDVDLSLAVGAARSKHPSVANTYDRLIADSADERAKAYRQLAELAASPQPAGLLTSVATILTEVIALEASDSAAEAAVVALSERVPAATSPLPKDPAQYDVAYWAAETLAASLREREGAPEGRAAKTIAAINRLLGTSLAEADGKQQLEQQLRARVSERIYAQLTAASVRQPAEIAALFKDASQRAAVSLAEDEAERLEAGFLAAALPAAGPNWKPYEEAIIRLGSSDNPLNVLRLLDIYQRVTDAELEKHLAELLIVRASERPKSWSKADVARAVRKGLGAAGSAAMTDRDRWELLRVQADPLLSQPPAEPNDQQQLLAQTVELAHLTTMAIALAQGDAGYAVFDAGLEDSPSLSGPKDPADGRLRELPPPRRAYPPLNNVAKQELERVLDLLAGHGRLKPVQRESMLRTLATFVDRLQDLAPLQASQAAPYILGEKSDEEHAAVLQTVGELRRWKRLRLAIADALPQSKLTDEQRRQLVGVLLEADVPIEEAEPAKLQTAIVQTVVKDLEDAASATVADVSPTAASRVFDDAADLLLETYRTRARLLGVSSSQLSTSASPSQALQLSLVPLADSVRSLGTPEDATQLAALTQRSVALDFLATDDMRRTAAVEQVFVQLSALRLARLRPNQASFADRLAAEIAAADSSPNVLVQVRQHEATSLRLWMLYAPQL